MNPERNKPMELNPHHPTTRKFSDQWHKLLAVMMHKNGVTHVVITAADVEAATATGLNISVQELKDGIHLRLVDDETAIQLARQHGGINDANHN